MVTDWRAQGHRGEQAHVPGATSTLPGQAGPLPVMTQPREGPPGPPARESQPDPPCGPGPAVCTSVLALFKINLFLFIEI